jgi:DNA-binding GntR family transcriptional regulator
MPAFETAPPPALAVPRRARRARATGGGLVAWLAARILEHLRSLALEPGDHITEQALADHFRVSRTPVRMALASLAEANAVEHRPNRGYFVAQPPAALHESEVAAEDDDKLYYRIAEDRLNGRIPARVTESELVRKYRASRTRITAVLSRMGQEGWLERLPGHGWAFQPMLDSVKGYEDGYRFRALIEPAALRQPGYRLPAEAIERSRAIQRDLLTNDARYSDADIFAIGSAFHETIVSGSGNPFLMDAIRRVNSLRRLLEYRAKRNRDKIAGQFREHLALLDLIEAGKLEKAAKLMERHLDVARKTKSALVRARRPA